jgi:hypothetical protein
MIHSGHVQQASPLLIALVGLFFLIVGVLKVYGRFAANRRRTSSANPALGNESLIGILGSSGIVGVGLVIVGVIVACMGIAR